MVSLGGFDSLQRAQALVENSAKRIAQGPPTPDDIINLLRAREQFSAGVKVVHTEDEINQQLLNLLG